MTEQTLFEVNQLPIAKNLILSGLKVVNVRINDKGFMVFQFEKTDKTKELYLKFKTIHVENKQRKAEQQK